MTESEPPEKPKPTNAPGRHATQRYIPPPWVDCPECGWRHYPDSSIRRGPQIERVCSNCGEPLPPGREPDTPAP